jgi:hypothetical protein
VTITRHRAFKIILALAVTGAALIGADHWGAQPGREVASFTASAEARVGRPMTPMSYAGVARRTTRRAVAVGSAGAAYGYYENGCTQIVDPYGQVALRCP